jgi:hypothetical protein
MLRDPLIHFLLAGGLLFAVLAWRGGEPDTDRIHITADRVAELGRSASLLEGRELNRAELEALIEPVVREEVYYREALALGLDVDDDEVRRRLVEKMRYLSEDLADPEPASDRQLADFYASHPERFEIPAAVTFDQVFFSPEQRGGQLDADISAALEALADGADPATLGDPTPLDARLVDAPRARIRILFGDALTDAVFSADPGRWLGPFRSDFGSHLVRVISRSPARLPAFDEIEQRVRDEFGEYRRAEANAAEYRRMLERYDVVIDWPAGTDE